MAIGSNNLLPFVKKIIIDKDRQFAPRRAVTKGDGLGVVYTDHFPSILELQMPKAEESMEKPVLAWNTVKPGAWEKYKEISNKVAEQIELIVADEGLEDEEVMDKVDKIQTKLKFAAFQDQASHREN